MKTSGWRLWRPLRHAPSADAPVSPAPDAQELKRHKLLSLREQWPATIVAVLLLAGTWIGFAVQVSSIDSTAQALALTRATELAASYATDVASAMAMVDNLLKLTTTYAGEHGIARTAGMISQQHLYLGLMGSLALLDVNGQGKYSNLSGIGDIDLHDRQHFQLALHNEGQALIIGAPLVARLYGVPAIPFARTMLDPDGNVTGVGAAVIDLRFFAPFHTQDSLGAKGVLSMLDSVSGVVLSRIGSDPQSSPLQGFGQTFSGSRVLTMAASESRGAFWQTSMIDGVRRAVAFERLPDYPIIVVAGLALEDIAARTLAIRINLFIAAVGASILIVIMLAAWLQQQSVRKMLSIAKDEAIASTRVKSEFLANMSHEIRTPMNAVIGLSRLALKAPSNPKQREYLVHIHSAATALLGIINDILDFSKIEAGKIDVEKVPFGLDAVVDSVTNVASLRASEKGLELQVAFAPDVPRDLIGDPMRLGQVLLNLVNNAVKFTEKGKVAITIGVDARTAKTVELFFSVRDTGIGISEEERGRLFQSFAQADASTTRRFGGTGLGLAISKSLAEMMGGTIDVESRPGVGSVFTLTVPLALPLHAPKPIRAALRQLSDLRVLVVDDNAASRDILGGMLSAWSMQVGMAASGAEAISAVRQAADQRTPYDLVLMDWQMPGMDGIATARLIARDGGQPKVPVIFMVTAHGRSEMMAQADDAGIASCLVKPIDSSMLLESIASAFGNAEARTINFPGTAPESIERRLAGNHVLLVEDNDINQQIAVEILTDAGLSTEIAGNGRVAVDMVLADPARFAAILMDLQMPEMDGFEATRLIREHIEASRLPIIAMTAHAMEQERRRCLAAGMNDHVAKPVDPAILIATLARWVKPCSSVPRGPNPDAAKPPPAAGDLPETLPPFDIASALRRVNGNRALLRKLIIGFNARFAATGADLRDLVAAGKLPEAERLAHSLTGVAAQLEVAALSNAARNLEQALRAGNGKDLTALLDRIENELAPVMAAAGSVDRTEPEAAAPRTTTLDAGIGRGALTERIADLRDLLARNSLAARPCFAALRPILAGMEAEPLTTAIAERLERLDFRGAERALDDLATRLGLAGPAAHE